jgi:hypothetical protein
MNDYIRRELAKLRCVKQFGEDHALTPENPAATAEYTAVGNAITYLETQEQNQESGKGTAAGAVDQRLAVVDDLLMLMRSLSKAAKVLDRATHPDVATKMRMSGIDSFEQLLARANVFHSTVQPIEAEFIALGAAATVTADLQAKITALQSAGNLKSTGLDTQIGGTAGLKFGMRAALKHVRKLDAILCQAYLNDGVLLAQWKAASRTERAPKAAETPGGGSGGEESQPAGS